MRFIGFCAALFIAFPVLADVHRAQYGVAKTFNFVLFNTDGTLDVDEVDGGAEVAISCDEGAETTATNDFVDEGNFYSIALTATELECARATVVVSATDTNVFFIETYGDLNAFSQSDGVASGTAQSATSTTIVLDATTNVANDFFNDHIIVITGGTGAGQTRHVSDWVQSTDTITVSSAWTTNPDSTSTYLVQSKNQGFIEVDANGYASTNVKEVEAADPTDTLADAIWDEAMSGHTAAGTAGEQLGTDVDAILVDTNTGVAISSTGADTIWDEVAESNGSITARQIMSLILAEALGACDFDGTSTWTCEDPSGTSGRFTVVYGADNGDRTSVTLTP